MKKDENQIRLYISFSQMGDTFEAVIEKIFLDYLKERRGNEGQL